METVTLSSLIRDKGGIHKVLKGWADIRQMPSRGHMIMCDLIALGEGVVDVTLTNTHIGDVSNEMIDAYEKELEEAWQREQAG